MKSESARERASAQTTRAAAAQPRHPRSAKVIATEVTGETFNGNSARTVISRKSQGSDRNRSVAAITMRSSHPPRKPAVPPIRTASRLETKAAAGADRKSTRLNSSHSSISYAVFCLKKKKKPKYIQSFTIKKKNQS